MYDFSPSYVGLKTVTLYHKQSISPGSANNYNPFMFAWFIGSGCASSVYLDSTRARLTPGLSTFRTFIYLVNLGISQC